MHLLDDISAAAFLVACVLRVFFFSAMLFLIILMLNLLRCPLALHPLDGNLHNANRNEVDFH